MDLHKITAKQLQERVQNNESVTLIDVRAEEKYHDFHIEGPQIESVNIPKTLIFDGQPLSLSKDKELIITCTTGNSAAKCAEVLQNQGYRVTVLEGGITSWKNRLSEGASLNEGEK